MSDKPHRKVSDNDWNQLITLASGYLSLENGDIRESMSRALSAHTELIRALKKGRISAEVPEGRVTMFVPESGGVALRLERMDEDPPTVEVDTGPPVPKNTSKTYTMDED